MIKEYLNYFGSSKTPIFFLIDFDIRQYFVQPLYMLDSDILFEIDGFSNKRAKIEHFKINLKKNNISFDEYKKKFDTIQDEIKNGNTYLLNLSCKTNIELEHSLLDIYKASKSKFKLYFKDKFICFSPERFINIEHDKIFAYPMKGTIDANIPNAKEKILNDSKEMAEHIMVVDLLRNDLNMVSSNVRVEEFRYIEKINAGDRELLQVSSKIAGDLGENWQESLGDILLELLPAGSISGTPKKSSVDIIKSVEGFDRGFFSGIFGYFDGEHLDSSVIIRYIEKEDDKYFYKSGCGITSDSVAVDEYLEMKNKIYVPVF